MLRNELLIYFPSRDFFSGEKLEGYAELRLPLPLKTFGLTFELFGRELAEVNGRKELNKFLHISSVLVGPGSKDRGKTLFGKKNKKAEQIPVGTHRYPFTIDLPEHIPPSYANDTAKIEYEIQVTVESVDKGMSNLVSSAKLTVGGSLFDMNFLGNKSTPLQIKENKTFFMTKGSLDVTLSLDSQVFLSGDVIKARFDFVNGSSKRINTLTVKLLQKIDIVVGGKTISEEYQLALEELGALETKAQLHPTVDLPVPTTAPESVFKKQSLTGVVGKIVQISYEIFVKGEGSMGSSFKVCAPIHIVRRARHQQLVEAANQLAYGNAAAAGAGAGAGAGATTQQQPLPPPPQQHMQQLPPPPQHLNTGYTQPYPPYQDRTDVHPSPYAQPPQPSAQTQASDPYQPEPASSFAPTNDAPTSFYPSLATEGTEFDFSYEAPIKSKLPPPPRKTQPNQTDDQSYIQPYDQFFE